MSPAQNSLPKLFFCAIGTFASYSMYGVYQEKVTHTRYGPKKERFVYTTSLVLLQCAVNALVAIIAAKVFGGSESLKRNPAIKLRSFALCAMSYIGAMFASNHSLQHVNYPTQVLAKSAKPIAVMVVGFLLGGFRYPWKKCLFVLMISIGVVFFIYKEPVKKKVVSEAAHLSKAFMGEILLLVSLTLDGVTSLFQERMRGVGRVGAYLMMLQMNLWSILYLTAVFIYSGEYATLPIFLANHPEVLTNMLLFGIFSGLGQLFIFTTVTSFGPLTCSIVTTTRKFFSILLSVALHQHPMLQRQWIGTVLVFTGLFLDLRFGNVKTKQN